MDALKCEAFLAAADTGSFTIAAERLGYTQSGITRMISTLEEDIGFRLFVRSKKGVVLTENGRSMVPLFREIVRAQKNAEQYSQDIKGIVQGTVTVGSYFSISAMWMPQILSRFQESYPGIQVRLQEGGNAEMRKWLSEKSVDCCFCAGMNPEGTDWIPLYQDEMVAWLPKDHPMASANSYPVRNLEQEPFIHTDPDDDTDQDRLIQKWHLKMNTRYTTRDGFATYNMVASGLGVSFNQKLISRDWNERIAEVPFDPPEYITLGIAVPSLKKASPATRKFLESARKVLSYEMKQ